MILFSDDSWWGWDDKNNTVQGLVDANSYYFIVFSASERHLINEIAKIHLTSTWIEGLNMSEEKMGQNVGQYWNWREDMRVTKANINSAQKSPIQGLSCPVTRATKVQHWLDKPGQPTTSLSIWAVFLTELRVSTHPSTLVKVWGSLTVTILPFVLVLEDPAEIEIIREYKSYEVNSCVAANQKEWEFHN